MPRRTLSAALPLPELTQEARAFVQAGSPRPQPEQVLKNSAAPADSSGQEPSQSGELRTRWDPLPEPPQPEPGLSSLTIRVPREVPPALLLASMDRKLQRRRPWTQQGIVAEAITGWLRQHGYLV